MTKVQLVQLAHARSGDKGDTANVGVIAYEEAHYELLRDQLTPEAVKAHFGEMVRGEVERFELPNLHALNFLLHGALGGGIFARAVEDAQRRQHDDQVAERARRRHEVVLGGAKELRVFWQDGINILITVLLSFFARMETNVHCSPRTSGY